MPKDFRPLRDEIGEFAQEGKEMAKRREEGLRREGNGQDMSAVARKDAQNGSQTVLVCTADCLWTAREEEKIQKMRCDTDVSLSLRASFASSTATLLFCIFLCAGQLFP
jgi:hypothetical protein